MSSMLQSGDPKVDVKDYQNQLQLYYTQLESDVLLLPYLKRRIQNFSQEEAYILTSRYAHLLHLEEFVSYIRVVNKLIQNFKPITSPGNNIVQEHYTPFPTIKAESLVEAEKFAPISSGSSIRPADKKPCGCSKGLPCASRTCGCQRDGFGCIASCGCFKTEAGCHNPKTKK